MTFFWKGYIFFCKNHDFFTKIVPSTIQPVSLCLVKNISNGTTHRNLIYNQRVAFQNLQVKKYHPPLRKLFDSTEDK